MGLNYKYALPDYCQAVLRMLNDAGFEAYIVGGAVRDVVMGREPHDFDIATSATPKEIVEVMRSNAVTTVDMAQKHGTITAVINHNSVEITAYRIDGNYVDSRHPSSVEFTRSIEEDVARRDFTMNALYLSEQGDIVDLNGGLSDISDKVIRCVGNPSRRFEEDALRIMRGLRFAAELGFTIDEETAEAMYNKCPLLSRISGERINVEFGKLIVAPYASEVIRKYTDIISIFFPALGLVKGFNQHSQYHDKDVLEHTLAVLDSVPAVKGKRDLSLAYAALCHDLGKPSTFRLDEFGNGHMKGHAEQSLRIWLELVEVLKIPNKIRDEVGELIKYHDVYPEADRISVHKFLCKHERDWVNKLHTLQHADLSAHTVAAQKRADKLVLIEQLEQQIEQSKLPLGRGDLALTGKDLIEAGIVPGSEMGQLIDDVLSAVIEGKISNEHEALIRYAMSLRSK